MKKHWKDKKENNTRNCLLRVRQGIRKVWMGQEELIKEIYKGRKRHQY